MSRRNPKGVGRVERALTWLERTSPRFRSAYEESPAPLKALWWTVTGGIELLFSTAVLLVVGGVSTVAQHLAIDVPFRQLLHLLTG